MRTYTLLPLALSLVIVTGGCRDSAMPEEANAQPAAEAENPLLGTWELASYKYTYPDRVEEGEPTGFKEIKLVTPTHYVWMQQSTEGEFRFIGGGGRYELTPDTYTEHIDYFFNPDMVGGKAVFTWELDGDIWRHQGDLGEGENARNIQKVWRRVKDAEQGL